LANFSKFADGGAFNKGLVKFAYGGIVSSPNPFKFSSGGTLHSGLMGEAGPEAIMPLKRDSQARLGVSGGGGRGIVINDNRTMILIESIRLRINTPGCANDNSALKC
jgi:lambda family phage tail tape measure protein